MRELVLWVARVEMSTNLDLRAGNGGGEPFLFLSLYISQLTWLRCRRCLLRVLFTGTYVLRYVRADGYCTNSTRLLQVAARAVWVYGEVDATL